MPLSRSRLLCALTLASTATPLAAAPLPAWQSGTAGDLAFETSAFLQGTAYAKPDRVADQMALDGAYGPLNTGWDQGRAGHWLIEEQRYAIDAVIAGIGDHRQDLVARGEHIFD